MPCIIDINVNDPGGNSINLSPGSIGGTGFKLPSIISAPQGFPEDLVEIFQAINMLTPVGPMKAALDLNYDKSVFSAIMKLLNNLFPFLMLYKMLMPAFELVLCIIEVLCAIANPFKLIRAIRRLFSRCLPAFLAIFPPFALIIMILSLLLALLDIIIWVIQQIEFIVSLFIKNLLVIYNVIDASLTLAAEAINESVENPTLASAEGSILAVLKKIAQNVCMFKNIFIVLEILTAIFDLIKSLLAIPFSIPPCDSSNGSIDGCCTPDVCPAIVKNGNFTRVTGTLQYLNNIKAYTGGLSNQFLLLFSSLNTNVRNASHQFYDIPAELEQQFINITDPYDVTEEPKQVLFPSDANYTTETPIKQIPYLVDLKFLYDPAAFNRDGYPYMVEFKDCYVIKAPTRNLVNFDGSTTTIDSGVMTIVGGKGYDGYGNILYGYDQTGLNQTQYQATLENFIFIEDKYGEFVVPELFDTRVITDVEYTFKPVHEVLFSKNLITLGCIPEVALERDLVNTQFSAALTLNLSNLNNLFNSGTGSGSADLIDEDDGSVIKFPNPAESIACLEVALTNLTQDFSQNGISNFQASATACMSVLKDNTIKSIKEVVKIAFSNTKSTFSLTPAAQFTTMPIKVSVDLKDGNGASIAERLPEESASSLAKKIVPTINFGDITEFSYDGSKYFTADITSKQTGKGKISIAFDGSYLSTYTPAANDNDTSSISINEIDYEFIYSPERIDLGAGDTDGKPRRDESDVARNSVGE